MNYRKHFLRHFSWYSKHQWETHDVFVKHLYGFDFMRKKITVPTHNSQTPNSHTYPNSHVPLALTKMWLFGYGKDFGWIACILCNEGLDLGLFWQFSQKSIFSFFPIKNLLQIIETFFRSKNNFSIRYRPYPRSEILQ